MFFGNCLSALVMAGKRPSQTGGPFSFKLEPLGRGVAVGLGRTRADRSIPDAPELHLQHCCPEVVVELRTAAGGRGGGVWGAGPLPPPPHFLQRQRPPERPGA